MSLFNREGRILHWIKKHIAYKMGCCFSKVPLCCCVPPDLVNAANAHLDDLKAKKSGGATSTSTATAIPVAQSLPQPPVRRQSVMTEATAQKWLLLKNKKPGCKARVLCMGWAGSNSGAFKTWDMKNMEIISVELPARNARFNEKGMTDVNLMAKKIAQALSVSGYLESTIPLVIFGHSFGAMIGLHVARVLQKDYNYVPKLLMFAGCRPLHHWGWPMNYYREDDDEMVQEMVNCGGMTKEMAKDKNLIAMILPAIKADHLAMDKYNFDPNAEQVQASILALGGDLDPRCPPEQLPDWAPYTKGELEVKVFPGGHFFIQDRQAELLAYLTDKITEAVEA